MATRTPLFALSLHALGEAITQTQMSSEWTFLQ
jgi:hypothetical protein